MDSNREVMKSTGAELEDAARREIMTKWDQGLTILGIVYALRGKYDISPAKVMRVLTRNGRYYGISLGQTKTEGFDTDVIEEMCDLSNFVVGRILTDWYKYQLTVDETTHCLMSEGSEYISKDLVRLVLKQNGIMSKVSSGEVDPKGE
ncbi:hypothetical protein MMC14_005728 [Varicellaria rhodocarpa]|nr:hypothetical protein [Varicellaria rhodocarpa]